MDQNNIKIGVYLINEEGRYRYKIGYSGDIDSRLKELQVANSDKLLLYDWFPTSKGSEIETMAQDHVKHKHIRGEWYELIDVELNELSNYINKTIIDIENTPMIISNIGLTNNKCLSNVKYGCELCNYNTNRKTEYSRHIKTKKHTTKINQSEAPSNNNREKEYKCNYCENVYSSQSSRSKHIRRCIKINAINELYTKPNTNTKYMCQYCKTNFATASSLARHRKICDEKNNKDNELQILKNKVETYEQLLKPSTNLP